MNTDESWLALADAPEGRRHYHALSNTTNKSHAGHRRQPASNASILRAYEL